jgi:glutamyl-tRNA(Gln) amidotransferase subunit D
MARPFRFVDLLRIKKDDMIYEGVEVLSYDPDIVVIKLKNGYNVGFIKGDVSISREKRRALEEKRDADVAGGHEVSILGTGGTIASYVDYATGAVYPARSTTELLRFMPEIGSIAKVGARVLFSVFSENMGCAQWRQIAQAVKEELDSGARGVVVTHGTDTMCYTASALAFMLPQLSGPVILTGAQRSTDRPSSDGFLNLLASVRLALTDLGEVVIAMHEGSSDDSIAVHRATRARKMHTSARGAFQTLSSPPLGCVRDDAIALGEYRRKKSETVLDTAMDENVALVQFYPGMRREIFDSIAEKSSGVVIAGTGLGHVSEELVESIKECGKPVCMTSQCLCGSVNLNVYATGRKLLAAGVIPCGDMFPETAYVKLMWVLGHARAREEVRELMQMDLAGELCERRCL